MVKQNSQDSQWIKDLWYKHQQGHIQVVSRHIEHMDYDPRATNYPTVHLEYVDMSPPGDIDHTGNIEPNIELQWTDGGKFLGSNITTEELSESFKRALEEAPVKNAVWLTGDIPDLAIRYKERSNEMQLKEYLTLYQVVVVDRATNKPIPTEDGQIYHTVIVRSNTSLNQVMVARLGLNEEELANEQFHFKSINITSWEPLDQE